MICLSDVSVHLQTIERNLRERQNLYTKSNVYAWIYPVHKRINVDVRSYPNSFSSHCFFILEIEAPPAIEVAVEENLPRVVHMQR